MRRLTVTDMMREVRSLLDENNTNTITNEDILSALNRAQDTCVNTLAQNYEDPLLTFEMLSGILNPSFTIPTSLEDRIESVELHLPSNVVHPLRRITYRDAARMLTQPAQPSAYYVVGKEVFLAPVPDRAYDFKVWYLKDPLPLDESQGMVSAIGPDYVMVDVLGSRLAESVSDLTSYIAIVNGTTGEVRASFQIQKLEGKQKLTLRVDPLRDSVYDLPISGSAVLASCGAQRDDYVVIHGNTCIPFLKKPTASAIIYLAVADLKGTKLNQDVTLDASKAASFLQKVSRTWAGREDTNRIRSHNNAFRRRSTPR